MSGADDLMREVNVLAAKIQRQRQLSYQGTVRDGQELAAMETRLTSLWTAIRAARAGQTQQSMPRRDQHTRSKWE